MPLFILVIVLSIVFGGSLLMYITFPQGSKLNSPAGREKISRTQMIYIFIQISGVKFHFKFLEQNRS